MAKIEQLNRTGNSPKWLQQIRRLQEPAILMFVMRALGSTPRETNAWMIVTADDQSGTIGGGNLEYRAINKARQILSGANDHCVETFLLGPDLNQCCGGAVDLLLLRVTSDTTWLKQNEHLVRIKDRPSFRIPLTITQDRLVIYGAGHVGLECAHNFARLEFDVTIIDPREDRLALIPDGVQATPDGCTVSIDNAYVLVMTHDHQLDFDICLRLLKAGRFAFLGLIGSASKIARFKKRLREAGLSDRQISRLVSPIGLPNIPGKEPAVIAISVAAQILEYRAELSQQKTPQLRSLQND